MEYLRYAVHLSRETPPSTLGPELPPASIAGLSGERRQLEVIHIRWIYEISLTSDFKVATATSEKIYSPESLSFARSTEELLSGGESVEEATATFDNIMRVRNRGADHRCC